MAFVSLAVGINKSRIRSGTKPGRGSSSARQGYRAWREGVAPIVIIRDPNQGRSVLAAGLLPVAVCRRLATTTMHKLTRLVSARLCLVLLVAAAGAVLTSGISNPAPARAAAQE